MAGAINKGEGMPVKRFAAYAAIVVAALIVLMAASGFIRRVAWGGPGAYGWCH
jgi:hypothetical protein